MLLVKEKESGLEFKVYKIRNDAKGYPHFLIYKDNQWKWISAKFFQPM